MGAKVGQIVFQRFGILRFLCRTTYLRQMTYDFAVTDNVEILTCRPLDSTMKQLLLSTE